MVNKTGDLVRFRDMSGDHRLTGVSGDGIVQIDLPNGGIMTTDASEIEHNYNEAARTRASLVEALDQSAKGDVEYLGDFSKYAEGYAGDHTSKF